MRWRREEKKATTFPRQFSQSFSLPALQRIMQHWLFVFQLLFLIYFLPSTTTTMDFFSHSNREWQCEIFKAFFDCFFKTRSLGEHKTLSTPLFTFHSVVVLYVPPASCDT
jgi:hypothetical protein